MFRPQVEAVVVHEVDTLNTTEPHPLGWKNWVGGLSPPGRAGHKVVCAALPQFPQLAVPLHQRSRDRDSVLPLSLVFVTDRALVWVPCVWVPGLFP